MRQATGKMQFRTRKTFSSSRQQPINSPTNRILIAAYKVLLSIYRLSQRLCQNQFWQKHTPYNSDNYDIRQLNLKKSVICLIYKLCKGKCTLKSSKYSVPRISYHSIVRPSLDSTIANWSMTDCPCLRKPNFSLHFGANPWIVR